MSEKIKLYTWYPIEDFPKQVKKGLVPIYMYATSHNKNRPDLTLAAYLTFESHFGGRRKAQFMMIEKPIEDLNHDK